MPSQESHSRGEVIQGIRHPIGLRPPAGRSSDDFSVPSRYHARKGHRVLARNLLFIGLVVAGAVALLGAIPLTPASPSLPARSPLLGRQADSSSSTKSDIAAVVNRVDAAFRTEWSAENISPAARADDLTIVFVGLFWHSREPVPSLEEIRPARRRTAGRRPASRPGSTSCSKIAAARMIWPEAAWRGPTSVSRMDHFSFFGAEDLSPGWPTSWPPTAGTTSSFGS